MKPKQSIVEYNAVFEPAEEGGFDVSFPAFPGCVTFGRNFEEAQAMAQEVLALWIEELEARGSDLPHTCGRSIVQPVAARVPHTVSAKPAARYATAHR